MARLWTCPPSAAPLLGIRAHACAAAAGAPARLSACSPGLLRPGSSCCALVRALPEALPHAPPAGNLELPAHPLHDGRQPVVRGHAHVHGLHPLGARGGRGGRRLPAPKVRLAACVSRPGCAPALALTAGVQSRRWRTRLNCFCALCVARRCLASGTPRAAARARRWWWPRPTRCSTWAPELLVAAGGGAAVRRPARVGRGNEALCSVARACSLLCLVARDGAGPHAARWSVGLAPGNPHAAGVHALRTCSDVLVDQAVVHTMHQQRAPAPRWSTTSHHPNNPLADRVIL